MAEKRAWTKRRSASEWQALVSKLAESGEEVTKFCRRQGICSSAFRVTPPTDSTSSPRPPGRPRPRPTEVMHAALLAGEREGGAVGWTLTLAYYVGAYGPTVRIDAQSRDHLTAVSKYFSRLASGEILEEDFGQALGCHLDSIRSLIVRSVTRPPSKQLELQYKISGEPVFCWSNIGDGWLEDAEKVEILLADDRSGHQYLTREGVDDAVVEVCYRE